MLYHLVCLFLEHVEFYCHFFAYSGNSKHVLINNKINYEAQGKNCII